jgi:hypothetical protein
VLGAERWGIPESADTIPTWLTILAAAASVIVD